MSSTGQPSAEACSAQVARPGHLGDTTAHRCRSPLHTSQSTSSVFVCTPSASIAPAHAIFTLQHTLCITTAMNVVRPSHACCRTSKMLVLSPTGKCSPCEAAMTGGRVRTSLAAHPAPLDGGDGVGEASVQSPPVLLQAQAQLSRRQLYGPGRRVCPVDGVQKGQVCALP
jgi:hypothetical protein